jgi:hypothetical protein
MRYLAIELDELGVIDIGSKTGLDRFKIGAVSVSVRAERYGRLPSPLPSVMRCARATSSLLPVAVTSRSGTL